MNIKGQKLTSKHSANEQSDSESDVAREHGYTLQYFTHAPRHQYAEDLNKKKLN